MREHVYSLLDLHFGKFLAGRSGLEDSEAETFRILIQELSAALAAGHSCLVVNNDEAELLVRSHLVSTTGRTPLILIDDNLYIHRYFQYEQRLAERLSEMSDTVGSFQHDLLLDALFGHCVGDKRDRQREAAKAALERKLSIISGGPGTGKTSTVLKIILLLFQVLGEELSVGLAAPTGKAAARLSQALKAGKAALDPDGQILPDSLGAMTLHRMLGVKRYSPSFSHHRENPLPYDVVIVDEASMVDLAMMAKLVDGLRPESRLILLGDKDQLTSVEAGSVLGDLIDGLPGNTTILTKSYRFKGGISRLARSINSGSVDESWSILRSGDFADVSIYDAATVETIGSRYVEYMEHAALSGGNVDIKLLFQQLNRFQILCAVREGRFGVAALNRAVERYLAGSGFDTTSSEFYPGRPVLIIRNDYGLNLFNGDIGLCAYDREGHIKVWFEQHDTTLSSFLPQRLPQCETSFALSIHKSQGSEFDEVLVVLPENDSRILSRELVYTAITRAKRQVELLASKEILTLAIQRRVKRSSGLGNMLVKSNTV